jgi:hypothetical protein
MSAFTALKRGQTSARASGTQPPGPRVGKERRPWPSVSAVDRVLLRGPKLHFPRATWRPESERNDSDGGSSSERNGLEPVSRTAGRTATEPR